MACDGQEKLSPYHKEQSLNALPKYHKKQVLIFQKMLCINIIKL